MTCPDCDPAAAYRRHQARLATLAQALRELATRVGCMPSRLDPDHHDALCESEYEAPHGDTPCDCRHRSDLVRAALTATEPPR